MGGSKTDKFSSHSGLVAVGRGIPSKRCIRSSFRKSPQNQNDWVGKLPGMASTPFRRRLRVRYRSWGLGVWVRSFLQPAKLQPTHVPTTHVRVYHNDHDYDDHLHHHVHHDHHHHHHNNNDNNIHHNNSVHHNDVVLLPASVPTASLPASGLSAAADVSSSIQANLQYLYHNYNHNHDHDHNYDDNHYYNNDDDDVHYY